MSQNTGKTFRSRSQLIGGIAVAVVGGGIGAGAIFSARTAGFSIAWGLMGLLCVAMGARLASSRIQVDRGGIRVVNFFKSFHLDWDGIRSFEMGRWAAFPSVCLIHLSDGRSTHAFGLQESTNFPNGSAQAMVDALNAELERVQPASQRPGGQSTGSAQAELFGS